MLFLSVADPDPACHFDAGPDPACHSDADVDRDRDPTFHVVADSVLDPHPSFQKIKGENLEKVLKYLCSYSIHFGVLSAKLMRIRILPFNLIWIRIRIHNTAFPGPLDLYSQGQVGALKREDSDPFYMSAALAPRISLH